jgi:hypothetical protein
MLKAARFVVVCAACLAASPSDFKDLSDHLVRAVPGANPKVSASSSSAVVAATSVETAYASATYNVRFQCPPGWTITAIDSVANRVLLNVAKTGRNNVLIYVTKHATANEATYWDSYSTWMAVRTTYGSATEAPFVTVAFDTAASPYHLSYVQLEYETLNGSRVYDLIAASKGVFSQFVAYSATTADYDANHADYDAIWDGLAFHDDPVVIQGAGGGGVLPKGASGVTLRGNTVLNPRGLRLEFRDATGRHALTSSRTLIELDKGRKLFLKVPAE